MTEPNVLFVAKMDFAGCEFKAYQISEKSARALLMGTLHSYCRKNNIEITNQFKRWFKDDIFVNKVEIGKSYVDEWEFRFDG